MHAVAQIPALRPPSQLRDSEWLKREMEYVWATHFADTPRANAVDIRFIGSWRSRLGVISLSEDERTSYIGINSLLSLPEAPYYVATITVAHELVHYAHGFGSPLPRRHRHPHRGRIVEKEFLARGLRQEYAVYLDWIHNHWYDFYDQCALNPDLTATAPLGGNARETYESQ